MKKLLLLAVLALGVIACDKNELGDMDSTSINPIDAKIEISIEQKWNNFVSLVSGYEFSEEAIKNAPSTAKGGDNGTNWIEVTYFTGTDTNGYIYLRPDNLGVGCYDNIESGVSAAQKETYTLIDNNGTLELNIQEADEASNDTFQAAIPSGTDFSFNLFFNGTSSNLFFAENTFLGWGVKSGSVPTATVND